MSQRGQSGGWRMARPAEEVSVADVIRALADRTLPDAVTSRTRSEDAWKPH